MNGNVESYSNLLYSTSMLTSKLLDTRKKSLFWHLLAKRVYEDKNDLSQDIFQDIFLDNNDVRTAYITYKKDR